MALLNRTFFRIPANKYVMGNIASFSILEPAFLTGLLVGFSASYLFSKRRKELSLSEKEVLSNYHEENFEVRKNFSYIKSLY